MKVIASATCVALAALVAVGCSREERGSATQTTSGETRKADNTQRADNTGINDRDKSGATMLPTDQAENPTDREITQNLRQWVVGEDSLSMQAKNVKIITSGQVVTLRGPVKSVAEKRTLVEHAQRIPNVKRVDDQLELEAAENK